jgi:hypothetical protein
MIGSGAERAFFIAHPGRTWALEKLLFSGAKMLEGRRDGSNG